MYRSDKNVTQSYRNGRRDDLTSSLQSVIDELLTVLNLLLPAVLEHLGKAVKSDAVMAEVVGLKFDK